MWVIVWNLFKKEEKVRSTVIMALLSRQVIQSLSEIIETPAKNDVVSVATSKIKLFFKDHMVRFKIISFYIYKDWGSYVKWITWPLSRGYNESRDHYHEDGNLVFSPRCGFSFEADFQFLGLKLTISVYIRNATFR